MINKVIEKFFVLGTTYFYRSWKTTSVFAELIPQAQVLAKKEGRPLKLKVFACSTGEECLTFAFALLAMGIENFRILGTDINQQFLDEATQMGYQRENFERLPDELRSQILKQYFTATEEGYAIKDKAFFGSRLRYQFADITKPLPKDLPQDFAPPYDMISCQNILMYLNPKSIPKLYQSLMSLVSDRGQFILVDKDFSHRTLRKNLKKRPFFFVNEHLLQILPQATPKPEVLDLVKNRLKKSPTFALVTQFCDNVNWSPAKKHIWLKKQLQNPGNHSLLYKLSGLTLIEMGQREQARKIFRGALYEFPAILDFYLLLAQTEKKLNRVKSFDYWNLLIKATKILFQDFQQETLRESLNLFQGALQLNPDEWLGYYLLAFQLFRYGEVLKRQNQPLIEYEKFLEQCVQEFSIL